MRQQRERVRVNEIKLGGSQQKKSKCTKNKTKEKYIYAYRDNVLGEVKRGLERDPQMKAFDIMS